MPDTSAVADIGGWQGAALLFVGGLGSALYALGQRWGKKAQEQSAAAPAPEVAGAAWALIDSRVQQDIRRDTERSADADEATAKSLARVVDILEEQVELQKQLRDKEERQAIDKRLDEADRDRRAMMEMIRGIRDNRVGDVPGYRTPPRDPV